MVFSLIINLTLEILFQNYWNSWELGSSKCTSGGWGPHDISMNWTSKQQFKNENRSFLFNVLLKMDCLPWTSSTHLHQSPPCLMFPWTEVLSALRARERMLSRQPSCSEIQPSQQSGKSFSFTGSVESTEQVHQPGPCEPWLRASALQPTISSTSTSWLKFT